MDSQHQVFDLAGANKLTIADLKKMNVQEQQGVLSDDKSVQELHKRAKAFYADKETLGHQVDGYSFLNFVPITNKWVENCQNCRQAMKFILIGQQAKLKGITGTEIGVIDDPKKPNLAYYGWLADPTVENSNEFWFCSGCSSVWTIVKGSFWAKVEVEGESTLDELKIKPLESEVIKVAEEQEIDMGEKLSEDATPCPNCHVWRSVEPYSDDKIQHVCPKCHAVDLYKIPVQEQVQE